MLMLGALSFWTKEVESGERPKDNPGSWIGMILVFIFLYGFFLGYPFYIPVSVYAVRVGGANAATLTTIIDLAGLVASSAFAYFGVFLSEIGGVSETTLSTWRYVFYCSCIIAAVTTIAMCGFQYFNLKAIKKAHRPNKGEEITLSKY